MKKLKTTRNLKILKGLQIYQDSFRAFTLAEVLITLGIIGVVAAITMPTLIQNYKKTVYVNQLKKSVSTISQGLQKLMADDGVTSLSQLSKPVFGYRNCERAKNNMLGAFKLAEVNSDKAYGPPYCHEYDDGSLYNGHFSVIDIVNYRFEGDGYYLQDGSLFGILTDYYYIPDSCNDNSITLWGALWIDVNGDSKGPNERGRDIFYFHVLDDGNLLPINSRNLQCSNGNWNDKNWKDYGEGMGGCSSTNKWNDGCAARIIEEGWKMNY